MESVEHPGARRGDRVVGGAGSADPTIERLHTRSRRRADDTRPGPPRRRTRSARQRRAAPRPPRAPTASAGPRNTASVRNAPASQAADSGHHEQPGDRAGAAPGRAGEQRHHGPRGEPGRRGGEGVGDDQATGEPERAGDPDDPQRGRGRDRERTVPPSSEERGHPGASTRPTTDTATAPTAEPLATTDKAAG